MGVINCFERSGICVARQFAIAPLPAWSRTIARSPSSKKRSPDPASVSLGRLGNFLGFRLRRLQNQLARDFHARTREWNLRAGQFSALEIIAANPGISQTNLSREVGLDKSVMVSLIDDLETRGWVTRGRSETDRRHYRLLITPAGQQALDKLFAELEITEATGLEVLSTAERAIALKALDLVYTAYVRPNA